MKKYHVHVYKLSGLFEIDVKADTDIEARTKALNLAKKVKSSE